VASSASSLLIGISCYIERARFGVWETPAAILPKSYVDIVAAAGALPVILPPVGEWDLADLSRLDGLILAGGPDVDPARYGQAAGAETDEPRTDRDASELRLVETALRNGFPTLGICRGMQVMNVALGGTLRQHIPDDLGNTDHRPQMGTFGRVEVTVAAESQLAAIVGQEVGVHCHHHQAVDRLGTGLAPVAWAQDGCVEAVEVPGDGFAIGVQWHPERDLTDVRLIKALVQAATKGSA
jgi:putative glutamine amidotransferase